MSFHKKIDSPLACGRTATKWQPAQPAERLVGIGFRCWLAGYDTGDIACWETGWNEFSRHLGTERAKRAVTELACWVRTIRGCACRPIEYFPFGCSAFCRDERYAISLIAASQHQHCPAMRACAFALTGSSFIDPVMEAASSFAHAMQDADQLLSPGMVAALPGDKPGVALEGLH
jgi:hypothetical protein